MYIDDLHHHCDTESKFQNAYDNWYLLRAKNDEQSNECDSYNLKINIQLMQTF
jgi:hypothetical protein